MRPVFFHYADHMASYLAVTRFMPQAEHVFTGKSSYAYWDELAARWDRPEASLLVIEQHIVVHGEVLPQLEECPGDWCVFPFGVKSPDGTFGPLQYQGLGCTRFSAALRRAVPSADIRPRAVRACPHCGAPHWAFIDGPVGQALREAGYEPCVHHPPAEHLPE